MKNPPLARTDICRQGGPIRCRLVALLLGLACTAMAGAQTLPPGCTINPTFGPFDYRPERYIPETTYGSHSAQLQIVEGTHFRPEMEALIRGQVPGSPPGGPISYTLNVFPNHHRALIALSKLAIREKTPQPKDTRYSVECYFQRAMVFRPDDNLVRLIYANHLIQLGRVPEAATQIDTVASRNPDSAFTQRNISLLYFESKNYEKALTHAHKASELGLNIDVLKAQLQKVGKWRDAPAQSPSIPDAASAPASAAASNKD